MRRVYRPLIMVALLLSTLESEAAVGGGKDSSAPPAPLIPSRSDHFGTTIDDPYRWMQDAGSVEQLRTWTKAQNEHARSELARVPHARELLAHVQQLSKATVEVKSYLQRGQRYFYMKRAADAESLSLYVRDVAPGSEERVLLDLATISPDKKTTAFDYYSVSRDGKYVCFGMSAGGSEESVLQVLDVDTGKLLPDLIDRTWNASPQWRPDNRSFLYRRGKLRAAGAPQSETNESIRTYLHVLGTDPVHDVAVFGVGVSPRVSLQPSDQPFVYVMPATHYAIGVVWHGVEDNFAAWIAPIEAIGRPDVPWRKIVDVTDQVTTVEARGDFLYFVSHHSQVLRMRADGGDLSQAQTLSTPGKLVIENVFAASDALYVQASEHGLGRLLRAEYSEGAQPRPVELPIDGTLRALSASAELPGIMFRMESWVRPPVVFSYTHGKPIVDTRLLPTPDIDVSPFVVDEVSVMSTGGVSVPLSIMRARGLERDGSNPTWLTAYGAYGTRNDAAFQPRRIAWLAAGGIYAVCHVRGGGEYGEEWHHEGMKAKKQHSIDDALACARYLVAQKYTSPAHLAMEGGSAGGVVVGGAVTQAPELFAAAIMRVPVVDLLALKDMIVGPANQLEFGSAENATEFPYVLAMSAYHQIRKGVRYPAVLLTAAENDRRVPLWQAAKMAARLQAATASKKPILLRVEGDAGHGVTSTKSQLDAELADCYTFLLWQLKAAKRP
jgi:prolyl oligopeptidase